MEEEEEERATEENREVYERHRDHMVPAGLHDPSRLSHLTQHTRTNTHRNTSAQKQPTIHTHKHTLRLIRSFCARARVFTHLVAVPNKADRLTGHIASNRKSGRESDRGRQREREGGRKDLALNGVLRH